MSEEITIPEEIGLILPESNVKDFRIKMEGFTKLLNTSPKKEKIQKHQGYEYLPISTVEKELDRVFFGLVQYECISYNQVFNEVACHARIKVFHPVINQWLHYDGLGSAVLQQDASTKVSDFHLFKKANAGQLTFPKAYAEAIKNAAKKIGKRFGSDINRKFEDEYEPMYKEQKPDMEPEPLKEQPAKIELPEELVFNISISETREHLTNIWNSNPDFQTNKEFLLYIKKRQLELNGI